MSNPKKLCSTSMGLFHTCLTVGPIQLFIPTKEFHDYFGIAFKIPQCGPLSPRDSNYQNRNNGNEHFRISDPASHNQCCDDKCCAPVPSIDTVLQVKITQVHLGEEPWSISGYGRRFMFQRSWVQIPAPYTGLTFFHN